MTNFFEFLFSPSGYVGRGVWWLTQLVYWVVMILLALCYLQLSGLLEGAGTARSAIPSGQTWAQTIHPVDLGKLADLQAHWNAAPGGLLVVLVIEIKRWHDLGMSGFFVLLRFVPALLHGLVPASQGSWRSA
jgi:uncharacterized membrane protein YhaH (DUF805 family)